MLAIAFPLAPVLLLLAFPLASASRFTLLPNPRPHVASKLAAADNSHTITHVSTASTETASTLAPLPFASLRNAPPQQHDAAASPRPQQPHDAVVVLTTTTSAPTTLAEQVRAAKTTEAPPADDPEVDADLARDGYSQITYYSCEAYVTTTMCGWHVPVVHAVSGAATAARQEGARRARAAAGWALIIGVLIAGRW